MLVPPSMPHSSSNLLLIHQTKWQQQLLYRYGNELTMMDATYKTTKYALPLFCICMPTNVNYIVVGTIVTEKETTHDTSRTQQKS